jgi:phosphomannomutase
MKFDLETKKNIDQWLQEDYDTATKTEIKKLLEISPETLADAFYTHLQFGTGGLRGIMGVGTNRMNGYTVRQATQGLANYLLKLYASPSIFIGFDSRLRSEEFAKEAAKVLASNGIRVYLGQDIRPSPWVSFGCRYKKCQAAIMITASHNPPEYNGYKVYWEDGAQILPPHDKNILAEINLISDLKQVKNSALLDDPLIVKVGQEIDEVYLNAIAHLQIDPDLNRKKGNILKIVYSSLHGTGITLVPKALRQAGFPQIFFVESQIMPDGLFPTLNTPNPEERSALKLGVERLKEVQADLLIATDPDADRVGVAVHHQNEVHFLNGNQIACLCLEYILAKKELPSNATFIKTIGTTELFRAICQAYHRQCVDVLTGFKYIAEKIREWERDPKGPQFIFGGEESYGYLIGTETRDKDAVTASVLIAEVALSAKSQSKTLIDLLHDLYKKYGFYKEILVTLTFKDSKEGKEQMEKGMEKLRRESPKTLAGIEILCIEDYLSSQKKNLSTGCQEPLELPKSNVLRFHLRDGSTLMIRPSGTEPKIKIYCGVTKKTYESLASADEVCEKQAQALSKALEQILL